MPKRQFLPQELTIQTKEDILPFFQQLLDRDITSAEEFKQFLKDVSEIDSAISEDMAWRYIRMTCDTSNKEHEASYLTFVQEIQPHLAPFEDQINKKIVGSPFIDSLKSDKAYFIYFRSLEGAVELFREENIPIQADLQTLAQEYSAIQGAMGVVIDGQEYTMQQAGNFLQKTDREVRETAWKKMYERRNVETDKLEALFDEMVQKRQQIALNAGFDNYRDYMFKAMGRYDYTKEDCFQFHNAIEKAVVPLMRELMVRRKSEMGLEQLKPWDTSVDPLGREPLKPFDGGADLLSKSLNCLNSVDSWFSGCLEYMKNNNLLDLESRKGKAPGGYNYPLAESNVPFIFMNASGNLRDVETLVHEAGHAIHSFLMAPLELNSFKNTPSEVAELASMSMELISMDGWNAYFDNEAELTRAKLEQIEGVISTLPWIANVDAFQHWVYENPNHSRKERKAKWLELSARFGTGMVDYTGYEDALAYSWHKQLHIFEIPFYYIEYGFAQLGAIGMWKLYTENRTQGLESYKKALKLGYTQNIPEVYAAAGLEFNFSEKYVTDLFDFLQRTKMNFK
ncbi:MAG: M3 family oligoendopeptidase [Bacteroidia bacterium]|nr:M3 family oligoendopeptidase [Bacteroidia bacterium]